MSHFGINKEKIIDTTTDSMEKSLSIKKWVKDHNPKSFIVLDDDSLFDIKDDFFKSFYRVSTIGLTPEDIPKILKMI